MFRPGAPGPLRGGFNVAADVWSATSYNERYRDAVDAERYNRLHPNEKPRVPYLTAALGGDNCPIIAASDYVRAVPGRLSPWAPAGLVALGTDGYGRSDTREGLRRFFEVDAEHITYAALGELARTGTFDRERLAPAMKEVRIDADSPSPRSR